MDNRIKYTKMVIRQAFIKLLGERPVDKISVTEICKLAEINRATFYRYYENQYELLSTIQNEMMDEIQSTIADQTEDIDSCIRLIFQKFYERRDEWMLLLGDNADTRFLTKIYRFFSEYFQKKNSSEESRMRYQFLLYGISGLFDQWTKNGMKEPPDTMAAYATMFRRDLAAHRTH